MAVSMLAVVILSGCSNQEAIKKHTASGKPEAEYPGKTKEQVKEVFGELRYMGADYCYRYRADLQLGALPQS